ncbi:MAG: methyltransferase domain-containing protein [Planctomycetota bacterium]|nr:MAG: methyltransferase domain-containing protein [Planctomycetota bacterium]REJ95392.1 MAG: methyltransferase domain-containing protein [Planctomycetota bacterium]REK17592.1 MAG: methyltransferase domain-containing protein [Planctomycetota bacterium]REK39817.1 MAG: methyltransferase domain-containing protein [Planctomycetota bacterium]
MSTNPPVSISPEELDQDHVARKLPHEEEHLEALRRMAGMAPYYAWVRDQFEPWIGQRILDAGCGVGNFINQVADRCEYVLGVDLSPLNLEILNRHFAERPNVEAQQIDLDEHVDLLAAKEFDTVVCLDVLEHIEDDSTLLSSLARIVKPGGHVLIKVPACQWLFGSVDVASDHYRRYNRPMLRQRAEAVGLEVLSLRYMNIAGVVPYFIKSRVLKKPANFSRTFTQKQLDRIVRLMPWIRRLDRLTGPFVGQSVVMAARRPAS